MKGCLLILTIALMILEGCSGRNNSRKSSLPQTDSLNFSLPNIPGIINEPQDKMDYLVEHL